MPSSVQRPRMSWDDLSPSWIGRFRRLALHKQNALDLVPVHVLIRAANLNHHVHPGHGNEVPAQYAPIAQLDGVMCGRSQFIAHAPARRIIGTDVKRELAAIESFFAEFEQVLADS